MDNKRYDAYGNEFDISQNDFNLTQVDKKIHDKKFDTKATTFAKDALKRFCKNKSSVVAAIIIAILMILSFLLPVVTPYNIDPANPNVKEVLMLPKIREYKPTGLIDTDLSDNVNDWKVSWTGTKIMTGLQYDPDLKLPYEKIGESIVYYPANVVKELDIIGIETNSTQQGSNGGMYILKTISGKNTINLQIYQSLDYTADENFTLKLNICEDNLYFKENFKELGVKHKGEYRILLKHSNGTLVLQDWSKKAGEILINVSELMAAESISVAKNANVVIELKSTDSKGKTITYLPIESLFLTTDSEEEVVLKQGTFTKKEVLAKMSMTNDGLDNNYDDAAQKLRYQAVNGVFPINYWRSNGDKRLYNAYVYKCDFVLDKYQHTYGNQETLDITYNKIIEYQEKGWCKYEFTKNPETGEYSYKFEVLDPEKCPIVNIKNVAFSEVEVNQGEEKVKVLNQQFTCEVTMYKYLGYKSMPRYLLGSDDRGYDIIVYSFNGLKKSFLVSIIISAICLSFGLVWGSISGYFGGNVDLFMERFCEILSGVPSTVVITLVVLLLGDSLITFGLALCMTGWLGIAGRTRTQFYRFKGREYILASRTLGSSDMRLIFKHILPNSLGTIVTSSVLSIPSVIFSEASLSYLGILKGANSFGSVLSHNQKYISSFPMLIVFPSIIISLIMISFNLFGNGLRDALNPSLKGSE